MPPTESLRRHEADGRLADVAVGEPCLLTFVLCTRNDGYMGRPMQRLQTSLNFLAHQVALLGRTRDVEILVVDWGSTAPASREVVLSRAAAQMCSFLYVPPALAARYDRDSPFAEVFPINVGVRRARGRYVARIDQDTVVAGGFLRRFFEQADGRGDPALDLEGTLLFAARKQLPRHYAQASVSVDEIERFIRRFGAHVVPEEGTPFYGSAVGIILAHRQVWEEAGGYDERLIYYWYMDWDFATRVKLRHRLANVGAAWGYDFYHLEHFPFLKSRRRHRRLNGRWATAEAAKSLNPNGRDWGLSDHEFDVTRVHVPAGEGTSACCVGLWSRAVSPFRDATWLLLNRTARWGRSLLRPLRPSGARHSTGSMPESVPISGPAREEIR